MIKINQNQTLHFAVIFIIFLLKSPISPAAFAGSVIFYCAPVTKDEFKLNHHDDIAFLIT